MKKTLLFLLMVGSFWSSRAQFQKPDVTLPSPNAAALGKFGGIPVSYYTGLPQISLPLFTISDGKASVPVSLSYHGSGIRVNEHPGWVGLNWNLSAGGAVTRKVNYLPDEFDGTGNLSGWGTQRGYLYRNSTLRVSDWETENRVRNLATDNNTTLYDLEPDAFNFSLPNGISGKFWLDDYGNFKVQSDDYLEVAHLGVFDVPIRRNDFPNAYNPNITKESQAFKGFVVTDEEGTKYYFGNTAANGTDHSAIEYTLPFFNQMNSHWVANSWFLKLIRTADGNEITFNYDFDNRKFINSMYPSFSYASSGSVVSGKINLGFSNPTINEVCGTSSGITTVIEQNGVYDGVLIRPTYLREIISRNAKIVFDTQQSTEARYPESTDLNQLNVYRDRYKALIQGKECNTNSDIGCSQYALPFLHSFNEDLSTLSLNNILQRLQWRKLTNVKMYTNYGELVDEYAFEFDESSNKRLTLKKMIRKGRGGSEQPYTFAYYDNPNVTLPGYLAAEDGTDHWGFYNGRNANIKTLLPQFQFDEYYNQKEPTDNLALLTEGMLESITYPTNGSTFFEYEQHDCYRQVSENRTALENTNKKIGGLRIKKIFDSPCTSKDASKRVVREFFYVQNYAGGGTTSSGILASRIRYYWNTQVVTNQSGAQSSQLVFSSQNTLYSSGNSNGAHLAYREVAEKFADGGYRVYKFTNFESEDGDHYDEVPLVSLQRSSTVNRTPFDPYTDLSLERGKLLEVASYRSEGGIVAKDVYQYKRVADGFVKSVKKAGVVLCTNMNFYYLEGIPYKFYTFKYKLDYEEHQLFGGGTFVTRTNYQTYNSHGKVTQKQMPQSDGRHMVQKLKYVGDYSSTCFSDYENCRNNCAATYPGRSDDYTNCINGCQSTFQSCLQSADDNAKAILAMKSKGMIGLLVESKTLRQIDGQERTVAGTLNQYREFGGKHQLSKVLRMDIGTPAVNGMSTITGSNFITDGPYNTSIPVVELNNYDSYGNPTQFTESSGIVTNLEWWDGSDASKAGLLRSKNVGGLTTNYDYKQLVGVNNVRDPNNNGLKYEYDSLNRLIEVRNQQDNVLNKIQYNFGTSPCN